MPGRRDLGFVEGCDGWGAVFCGLLQDRQERAGYAVIALGSNVHIFVRPHRREELIQWRLVDSDGEDASAGRLSRDRSIPAVLAQGYTLIRPVSNLYSRPASSDTLTAA
jgi:hypothetical protein